ncbi:adenosine deaminase 2-like [Pectinophora gossypiella]|uniref:adenosine deaminase 2-like n=1 Tax=Pectinophora gossypiella TaxID=13191 RepID=UPI00214EE286|nr:adenosine deaminase 2-like [Pectinophora gossypiella]
MWRSIGFVALNILTVLGRDVSEVLKERKNLLETEMSMMLGRDIILSDSEIKANEIIMNLKYEVIDNGCRDPGVFNLSKHFFEYKEEIKKTTLYKIIKAMPKGAVLHAHDTALLDADYILELTYLPDLYVCFQEEYPLFLFSEDKPRSTCDTRWQLLKEARYSSGNVEKFDAELRKHFTIEVDNPKAVYSNINTVWNKFQQVFIITEPLFSYKPVWEKYFYDSLKKFREDNVMYIEIRSVLPQLYDLEGNIYDIKDTAVSYKNVLDQFKKDYPDFFGAKLIYAPLKFVNDISEYIKTAKELKNMLPTFFAGFDLVGQEDTMVPLKKYMRELVEAEKDLDFFLHAGETNWYGTDSDENIADAIVLNTKRIGHAFALTKHPLLLKEVKKRNIAIEVNVISNNVLKLVDDVRNHPLATFLAIDAPVVISCDDPGLWGAEPLTHDFYVAFVGVASKHADLRVLKKLALNSLYYSTIYDKDKLVHEFDIRWTKFIDSIVRDVNASS